jgi:MFS family permease
MTSKSLSGYSIIPYLIVSLSIGMQSAFFVTEMPYLMRVSGFSIETIGWYSSAATIPYIIQPFINPLTDAWIRRRSWFIIAAVSCALSIVLALQFIGSGHSYVFFSLIMLGQILYGLTTACYGGLAATTLDSTGRLRASNMLNMGAQAGGALGATALLAVTHHSSAYSLPIVVVTLICLPALAALLIDEPARAPQPSGSSASTFLAEVRQTLRSRDGQLGVVLCLCPAGTIALNAFLPALAIDYHAPEWMTVSLNGYAGWILTLIGVYIGGLACLRIDPRLVYIASAVAMAFVGIYFALTPITPFNYAIASIAYCVVQGASINTCSAIVFELISKSKISSSTQYSIFYALCSMSQLYVLSINTHVYARNGLVALFTADAVLNIAGVVVLFALLKMWLRRPVEHAHQKAA